MEQAQYSVPPRTYAELRAVRMRRQWREGLLEGTQVVSGSHKEKDGDFTKTVLDHRTVEIGPNTTVYELPSSGEGRLSDGVSIGESRVNALVVAVDQLRLSGIELLRPANHSSAGEWILMMRRRLPGTRDAAAVALIASDGPSRITLTCSGGLVDAEWWAALRRRIIGSFIGIGLATGLLFAFKDGDSMLNCGVYALVGLLAGFVLCMVVAGVINLFRRQPSAERSLEQARALFINLDRTANDVF